MDEGAAFCVCDPPGLLVALVESHAEQDDVRPERFGVFHFHEWRKFRHHNRRGNAEPPAMIGDRLRMIAGAHRHHAPPALFRRERHQLVHRTAFLEGRGELQIFELQIDVAAGKLRKRAGIMGGRTLDRAANDPGRRANIVDCGNVQTRGSGLCRAFRQRLASLPTGAGW